MAPLCHESVLSFLLSAIGSPTIIIKQDHSAWNNALPEYLEGRNLRRGRVHIKMQKSDLFRAGLCKGLRNCASYEMYVLHMREA